MQLSVWRRWCLGNRSCTSVEITDLAEVLSLFFFLISFCSPGIVCSASVPAVPRSPRWSKDREGRLREPGLCSLRSRGHLSTVVQRFKRGYKEDGGSFLTRRIQESMKEDKWENGPCTFTLGFALLHHGRERWSSHGYILNFVLARQTRSWMFLKRQAGLTHSSAEHAFVFKITNPFTYKNVRYAELYWKHRKTFLKWRK